MLHVLEIMPRETNPRGTRRRGLRIAVMLYEKEWLPRMLYQRAGGGVKKALKRVKSNFILHLYHFLTVHNSADGFCHRVSSTGGSRATWTLLGNLSFDITGLHRYAKKWPNASLTSAELA